MILKAIFFLLITSFSFSSLAESKTNKQKLTIKNIKSQMYQLMLGHLSSIKRKSESDLKKTVTETFLKEMSKGGQLKELFSLQTPSKSNITFDIKVQMANISKDTIYVNIKDKSAKDYSSYWYVIKKDQKSNQFKIAGKKFIDN